MKKMTVLRTVLTLAMAAVILFGMSGCGKQDAAPKRRDRETGISGTVTAVPTESAGAVTPEATATPKADGETKGKSTKPADVLPVHRVTEVARAEEGELKVIWLGHSSGLLQMGSRNILFDPVFTTQISPVGIGGLNRFSEVPLSAEDVPEIDVLFLSHDHYDHMDRGTILAIDGRVGSYVVPDGADEILAGWGIVESKIHALNPWESVTLCGVEFTMTPAQHTGGRGLGPGTLCGGVYMKDGAHVVYYTGDGGYGEHFSQMYERLGAVDLLLAECGQYNESWSKVHMFPEQTAQVAVDVHAEWMIPVHWGAFVLALHAWDDSVTRCTAAAAQLGVNIATPEIGQTVDYDEISSYTAHWWEAYH